MKPRFEEIISVEGVTNDSNSSKHQRVKTSPHITKMANEERSPFLRNWSVGIRLLIGISLFV